MYQTLPTSKRQRERTLQTARPPALSAASWSPGLWEVSVHNSRTESSKTPHVTGAPGSRPPRLLPVSLDLTGEPDTQRLPTNSCSFGGGDGKDNAACQAKRLSISVPLTHSAISVASVSFNKLPCDSCRAWRRDWFKIPALLKLHCSSSSWVIFMWSVKLPNK